MASIWTDVVKHSVDVLTLTLAPSTFCTLPILCCKYFVYRKRKCADIIGTVLQYKCIFQIKYTEAILSNSTRKLLWFEITEMFTAV